MRKELIIKVYTKEREYEQYVFGDYGEIESLNLASFLNFLETYIRKARQAYSGRWENKLPPWLLSCKEFSQGGAAPVKTYEELIKVMALAGAALETYAVIDPYEWRIDYELDGKKWKGEETS